nr:fragile X mental retardation 1 neighbor protein isoform X3 [Pelodiscus sinensis]|eukprot:XP_025034621.1 fragile X mental retardation 1 neighbor protein isoform X3 [Pelodiscus sinensis]
MMQMVTGTLFWGNYVILVVVPSISPSLASPSQHIVKRSEVAPNKPKTKLEDISESLFNFFNPVTCRPKEDQTVVACHAGDNINETTCLKNRCCHSSKKSSQLKCYAPLKDISVSILC